MLRLWSGWRAFFAHGFLECDFAGTSVLRRETFVQRESTTRVGRAGQ
jgi:hypothetical protein